MPIGIYRIVRLAIVHFKRLSIILSVRSSPLLKIAHCDGDAVRWHAPMFLHMYVLQCSSLAMLLCIDARSCRSRILS